ncbi:MAG: hypothetical protein IVW53_10100 [Chloroflexi bacterium]|nr:hypothetical protein [Chloroflexota bacterium]
MPSASVPTASTGGAAEAGAAVTPASSVDPDRPPANLSASVWRSSAVGRPGVIGVVDITPSGIPPGLAGLYTALPGADGSTAWPPGQYVVELDGETADGPPFARWFGIAVRH